MIIKKHFKLIILIILLFFTVGFSTVEAARTDSKWNIIGNYIKTTSPIGYDILINGINRYLNFGSISGSSGYGIRDNSGTIECKDSGGSWSACQDGAGSGGGAGLWATSTDELLIHPTPDTYVTVIGGSATTTTGNIFEVIGNSLFGGLLTAYNTITAPIFTATSTTATSTLPQLDVTGLQVAGPAQFDGDTSGISINEIEGSTANHTINMNGHQMRWLFDAPTEPAFKIEGTGGFTGHGLLTVIQNTGNPTDTHLVHFETDDEDVLPLHIIQTADMTSLQLMELDLERANPADNDESYLGWDFNNDDGNEIEFVRLTSIARDVSSSTEDGAFAFDTVQNGTLTEAMRINGGNVGIGTTSPYAKLSVVGETVAANFTATSTSATNTFDGVVNINATTTIRGNSSTNITGDVYDLLVSNGNASSSVIKLGNNALVGTLATSIGAIDFTDTFYIKTLSNPASETQFVILNPDNEVRFAIPESGLDKGTYNSRSMIVAGPWVDNANYFNCSFWGFTSIDCDTSGTGADLGVQDDIQVLGTAYIQEQVRSSFFTATSTTATSTLPNLSVTNITGVDASEVAIALGGGSPTVDQVQEYLNNTGSSGFFSGGALSDGGAGTLDVAAGSGFIRTTNDANAELQSFKWSASSTIAVADDTTQYVYVDDSSVISLSTNEFLETPDKIKIGVVTDEGGAIEGTFNLGVRLQESVAQAGRFIRRVDGISRDVRKGGLIFGQSGDANRDVTMTTGSLWWGRTEYTISAFDTSGADTFFTYSANGQEDAAASQWPNAQYDNAGILTTMTNNRWANLFFWIEPNDNIIMVYGRAEFVTQAQAENEGVPSTSLPTRISETGKLAARYTFQKSANTATIASAFEELFANAGVTDHGTLAGLTDDDHTQYLLADGSRDLAGNWSAGGFDIDLIGNSTTTNATTTNISISGQLDVDNLTSALTLTGATGVFAEYTGTTCTNQFVRSLSALGVATCATVGAADVALANLTATNGTLTFSGTYDGSTARTIGLNLGNANTWTALQQFQANASSTQLSVYNNAYFGATATSSFDGAGILTMFSGGSWDGGGIDIPTGDTYAINGTDVLTNNTLGSGVLASSLTSLGTIASLVATNASTTQLSVSGLSWFTGLATFGNASSSQISATTFFGALTGNASTATALAANGGNCAAGSYPLGVDASGAVESCTDATTEIDSAISTHMAIVADTDTIGHLNDTDWDTFNNKSAAFTTIAGLNAFFSGESVASTTWAGGSSILTVGALNAGSITSGFGNIDIGSSNLDADGTVNLGGVVTISPTGTLIIPQSATCDSNANGEICHDTTDDQLIVDGLVIQTKTRIWGTTVASTSPIFIGAGLLAVPVNLDGYTMTEIRCKVDGGTNKVIAVEDAAANSTEDITCLTSVTSDDGSITNAAVTAAEEMYIDFGATTGAVDTVSISVYGTWTRE